MIAQLLLPLVHSITDKQLTLFSAGNFVTVSVLAGAVIIGILAGLLPALYLSSFRPATVLKGS